MVRPVFFPGGVLQWLAAFVTVGVSLSHHPSGPGRRAEDGFWLLFNLLFDFRQNRFFENMQKSEKNEKKQFTPVCAQHSLTTYIVYGMLARQEKYGTAAQRKSIPALARSGLEHECSRKVQVNDFPSVTTRGRGVVSTKSNACRLRRAKPDDETKTGPPSIFHERSSFDVGLE
eukprot:scaffold2043_cov166-Amphora_coffeaeformis.AAC.17